MVKSYNIALLADDGIGPEIINELIKVLKVVESLSNVTFNLTEAGFGANAYFKTGYAFPEAI
ncbi:MAG: hypothetical protein HRT51_07710 [Colwellia sp.]|nr:hypothetical protein [Colwellia sp.]